MVEWNSLDDFRRVMEVLFYISLHLFSFCLLKIAEYNDGTTTTTKKGEFFRHGSHDQCHAATSASYQRTVAHHQRHLGVRMVDHWGNERLRCQQARCRRFFFFHFFFWFCYFNIIVPFLHRYYFFSLWLFLRFLAWIRGTISANGRSFFLLSFLFCFIYLFIYLTRDPKQSAYTDALRRELNQFGISVSAVEPGFMKVFFPFFRSFFLFSVLFFFVVVVEIFLFKLTSVLCWLCCLVDPDRHISKLRCSQNLERT